LLIPGVCLNFSNVTRLALICTRQESAVTDDGDVFEFAHICPESEKVQRQRTSHAILMK
jgi:hypothetical protein